VDPVAEKMQTTMDRPDNVFNIPPVARERDVSVAARDRSRIDANAAQRSGQAIISLLQQAADVARRNEERAKAQALQLGDELRIAEERIHALETRLRHFETRAAEAEQWLMRIHDEVKERLINPLTNEAGSQERSARR
jgi:xanthine dehydrogenase molybdopterin-binding subunit B